MTSALLVIDVQRGMFMPPTPAHRGAEVRATIAGLLRRARTGGRPIVHVQHDGGPGDPLERGTEGWRIHPDVAPLGNEPLIEKRYCSAFQDTDLQALLERGGIRRLVIAGLQTEYCIDTTCRAAFSLGYRVVLAADAHSTFDTPILPAEKIIAHHSQVLGGPFCEVRPAESIEI